MSERVAIYSRKSNEQHGSEETRSIAMQEGHAQTCAAAQGWTVVGPPYLYEDDDISGKEFVRRPGLQRLLRDIDSAPQPPFDILMTMDESRLGRDLFAAGANLKRIVESGVRVYFYGEQRFANISDATNCIMTAVRLGGAQMEQEKAAERVTHTMHRKFALGHVCGGNVYGYRRVAIPLAAPDPTGKRRWSHVVLTIDPHETAQVVRIFELAAEGKGYGAIARLLTEEGVPSPSQRHEERHQAQGKVRDYFWGEAVIRQILHRKLYIGIAEYGKTKRGYRRAPPSRPSGRSASGRLARAPSCGWSPMICGPGPMGGSRRPGAITSARRGSAATAGPSWTTPICSAGSRPARTAAVPCW